MHKRVLLIEGDLRRRIFEKYFEGVGEHAGLLQVLTSDIPLAEAVQQVPFFDADVLRASETDVNAADVFSSKRFSELLHEARENYDVVIIDTPPVLVVPDARTIAQQADAMVFSVKWDATSKDQILEALRMFTSVNARPSGLVLNQINRRRMKGYG